MFSLVYVLACIFQSFDVFCVSFVMTCSSTYFIFLRYKKNLSMLPLNLVATISVTGLINTSTGYSCYLINKENPQFIISFISIGFSVLSESDCIVKQTTVCSVCYTKGKKRSRWSVYHCWTLTVLPIHKISHGMFLFFP